MEILRHSITVLGESNGSGLLSLEFGILNFGSHVCVSESRQVVWEAGDVAASDVRPASWSCENASDGWTCAICVRDSLL